MLPTTICWHTPHYRLATYALKWHKWRECVKLKQSSDYRRVVLYPNMFNSKLDLIRSEFKTTSQSLLCRSACFGLVLKLFWTFSLCFSPFSCFGLSVTCLNGSLVFLAHWGQIYSGLFQRLSLPPEQKPSLFRNPPTTITWIHACISWIHLLVPTCGGVVDGIFTLADISLAAWKSRHAWSPVFPLENAHTKSMAFVWEFSQLWEKLQFRAPVRKMPTSVNTH